MLTEQLGKSGLSVSKLSLGTVSLGLNYGIAAGSTSGSAPPPVAEAIGLIHHALDAGINFLDTARGYGSSEAVVGEALAGRRESAVIATKVNGLDAAGKPLRGDALRNRIDDSVHESLRLLKTDSVDLLMLHSAPMALLEEDEARLLLIELKEQGLARYIGASTYGTVTSRLAIMQGFDVIQVAYNVLDQQMADEVFPLAQEQGVGIVVRSVYLKGALTERAEDLPSHLNHVRQLSRCYRALCAEFAIDPAEAALRFALGNDLIDTVLVGVRNVPELQAALTAVEAGALPDELLAQFAELRTDDETITNPSTWGIP